MLDTPIIAMTSVGCHASMIPTTFAVDRMLGRLARWLRILGYDAAYGPDLHGPALVALARREGRVIVTRDTRLARQRDLPRMVFIERDAFREQLREVARAVALAPIGFCTRCLDCNQPLEGAVREAVSPRVPARGGGARGGLAARSSACSRRRRASGGALRATAHFGLPRTSRTCATSSRRWASRANRPRE